MDKKFKNVCFFTRRYDDLLSEDIFLQKFENQYFWVALLKDKMVNFIWIFGSDKDQVLDSKYGKIYFIKDSNRTHFLNHALSFYKQSAQIIKKESVDIVIGNGISDIFSHYFLKRKLESQIRFYVQDHASIYKPKYSWVKMLFNKIDGFLFNSEGLEIPWVEALLIEKSKVYFLPEGVSRFVPASKDQARASLMIKGDPVLLWVGNLAPLKDPMTCIEGIRILVSSYPQMKLLMIFQNAPMEQKIKEYIRDHHLGEHIRLIGAVPNDEINAYFHSADYYISSSLKEGSGYAAIEAMACGTIPILSDIPTFIDFTKSGAISCLFAKGSPNDLARKADLLFKKNYEEERQKLILHYKKHFSPEALSNQFLNLIESN